MGYPAIEQIGVCSWSLHAADVASLVEKVQAVGVQRVQLALTAHRDAADIAKGAQAQLAAAGITVRSGMFGTVGEDYSTPATIHATGGVVPDQHWPANQEIVRQAAATAAALGLDNVSTHAGFLPADAADSQFAKLLDRIAWMAAQFAEHDIDLLFETGQETAATLTAFMDALAARGATNCAVNFDPANMLLYNMGDPIAALKALMPRVAQVHIKDAFPPKVAGAWGEEVVVGTGAVDWPAFVQVLKQADFRGDLIIEREAGDSRVDDICAAAALLARLLG